MQVLLTVLILQIVNIFSMFLEIKDCKVHYLSWSYPIGTAIKENELLPTSHHLT